MASGHTTDVTDGQFRLDDTALSKVLCQDAIKNKPVAVVGIAGAMKTGKSFAMSFLLRYLRNKGWKNPIWLDDDDMGASDGFAWKVDRRPTTKGIHVWNDIFMVEKDNGEELAVLLVDTQGLFDRTMTREQNMRLLTFTVLLCSKLMLNIKDQINDRDLQYLQFFTQYAKTVLEKYEAETPFQDLIFLVRDWQYPGNDPYGLNGGRTYLSEVFEDTGNSEADSVRRDLRSAFEEIQSFLMPHPGYNVTRQDFEGRNSELDPEFLRCLKDLAHFVFDPLVLKERVHNGRPLTGEHLWSLLSYSNSAFQDGAAPEVKNMVEAFARMKNKLAWEDGLEKFNEIFEKKIRCTDYDSAFREAQEAALKYFDENSKFGHEEFREEYRKRLILDCQGQLKRISAWDELRMLKAKNSSAQKWHEVWTKYKDAMKTDMGDRYISDEAIQKLHSEHSQVAILEYQNETAKNAAFQEEHLLLLKDVVEISYCKLKAVNEERHMLETLGSQEDLKTEYEAYLLLHTVAQQYREEFEKYSAMYIEEEKLKEQILQIQRSYLEIFSKNWDCEGPNIHVYRSTLLRLCKEEFEECLTQNERNKRVLHDIIKEFIMTATVQYQEQMHQV